MILPLHFEVKFPSSSVWLDELEFKIGTLALAIPIWLSLTTLPLIVKCRANTTFETIKKTDKKAF